MLLRQDVVAMSSRVSESQNAMSPSPQTNTTGELGTHLSLSRWV